MDYIFDTLDLSDESAAATKLREEWFAGVERGFHGARPSDEHQKLWLTGARADGARCRGAWLPEGEFGAGPTPVATYVSFDKSINVGLDRLPLRMISEITASPAHRRRGLVRTMIEADLADADGAGVPMAALTASEATIYGRWGFGPATFVNSLELDTGPRYGLRSFTDPGRVEVVEPADMWPHISRVFEQIHTTVRGSVARPAFYEVHQTGEYDFAEGGPAKKLRAAVHLGADGDVDGFVLYQYDGSTEGKPTMKVHELLATCPRAHVALWDFLAHIDLSNRVIWNLANPNDPIRWALRDFNALTIKGPKEFIWVRVLDVPQVLNARPWTADGHLILGVRDPQGYTEGSYAVTSRNGTAEVTRSQEQAQVAVTAETLASLCLGAVSVTTLAAAGRVDGAPDAVAQFATMADLTEQPYTSTFF